MWVKILIVFFLSLEEVYLPDGVRFPLLLFKATRVLVDNKLRADYRAGSFRFVSKLVAYACMHV